MSKQPSPKADALRRMREENFARGKAAKKLFAAAVAESKRKTKRKQTEGV